MNENRADTVWDAGPMGCGELLMVLSSKLRQMEPGASLLVIANDPGAVEDMPAWCRLTGHMLKSAEHPEYLIVRKGVQK